MKCQKSNSSGRDQQSSRKKKKPKTPKKSKHKKQQKNPTKTRVCSGMVPGSGLQKINLKNSE